MNKKLFCLASLAALTLAGCGEKPEPKPDPDPDPQPTDPTVNDLKARFDALGDSYKATLMIPATEEGVEDAEVSIIINKYYTSVVDVAAIAGFNSGKYYVVLADAEAESGYEAQWGVYYNSQEEYVEEALLKNQEIDMTTFGYKENRGGFENKGAVAGAFNDYLGLTLLSDSFNLRNLVVKIDNEAKIVFEYYASALFKQIAYKVEVSATTETDTALEAWLETQEDPTAGFDGEDLITTAFYYANTNDTWTKAYTYPGQLVEHTYVTPDTMTRAFDEFIDQAYAKYASHATYASVYGVVETAGLYAYSSQTISVDEDAAAFEKGDLTPNYLGDYDAYWSTPGYSNPLTSFYYGPKGLKSSYAGLITEEVCTELGQGLRVRPETVTLDSTGAEVQVGKDPVLDLAEFFDVIEIYNEAYHEDGGYVVDEVYSFDVYPTFDDKGAIENLRFAFSGTAAYIDGDEEYPEELVYSPFFDYIDFYDFGKTVDPFGQLLLAQFTPITASVENFAVTVGAEPTNIVVTTNAPEGSTIMFVLDNKGAQSNTYVEIVDNGDGTYAIKGLAEGAAVVYIVVNNVIVGYFQVTVQAAEQEPGTEPEPQPDSDPTNPEA